MLQFLMYGKDYCQVVHVQKCENGQPLVFSTRMLVISVKFPNGVINRMRLKLLHEMDEGFGDQAV